MFKNEFKIARERRLAARTRIEAAEKKIGDTFLDWFFRRGAGESKPPSTPKKDNSTPQEHPKK